MSIDAFKSSDHEFNRARERQDSAAFSRYWDYEINGDDDLPDAFCRMCGSTRLAEDEGRLICKCGNEFQADGSDEE